MSQSQNIKTKPNEAKKILLLIALIVIISLLFIVNKLSKGAITMQITPHIANISSYAPSSYTLMEASDMKLSPNKTWWLNSGAKAYIEKDEIKTIQGELDKNDLWRLKYFKSNPTETDDGYHPQNIFRLVTKKKYKDPIQSMYFKVNKYILSDDKHRSASNGVLFFHRYVDGDNLYYAGIRVDGQAVIKKKIKGEYFTLVYEPIFMTEEEYNRESNPNLMPIDSTIGIKTVIEDIDEDKVSIQLFMDTNNTGDWKLAATAIDDGKSYGGKAIKTSAYAGIRTDFMDVTLMNYEVKELDN